VEMKDVHGGSEKRFYPPSIFAAGACAKVDRTEGTHKAPANIKIPNALDVERNMDGTSVINDNVREYLNARNTNVITPIANEGIKLYGARVSAPAGDTRIRFVHERRVLNLIYYSAKIGYSWAVFAVVDAGGRLFRDLRSSGQTFLRNLWRGGALYGKTEDEAFVVTADETNNPAEELEAGRVHVQIGVKLSPTAEMIIINIDNVPLSQDLNVLNGGNQ
ncbi:MAG TPA: phage tail sheath subtilisin-like domain-containing protein, partial [Pyrinomonadaceae bacterium]|nr:phage tail sheath subtilisin-like domain-containing protein [Pyrinomonadaceae bacterium]